MISKESPQEEDEQLIYRRWWGRVTMLLNSCGSFLQAESLYASSNKNGQWWTLIQHCAYSPLLPFFVLHASLFLLSPYPLIPPPPSLNPPQCLQWYYNKAEENWTDSKNVSNTRINNHFQCYYYIVYYKLLLLLFVIFVLTDEIMSFLQQTWWLTVGYVSKGSNKNRDCDRRLSGSGWECKKKNANRVLSFFVLGLPLCWVFSNSIFKSFSRIILNGSVIMFKNIF